MFSEELFRLGVMFDDGRAGTNLDILIWDTTPPVIVDFRDSVHRPGLDVYHIWISPQPTGRLTWFVDWPIAQLMHARANIEASDLLP